MEPEQALEIFRRTGMMQEGHFKLTSGLHSDRYIQCARLFQYPAESARVCAEIAGPFQDKNVDLVAGPAVGGIIMAYEVARVLGARNIFSERENGVMTLRRGFDASVAACRRALVVEDVVTTGGSVKELIDLLRSRDVEVLGLGAVVDRSVADRSVAAVDFGVPFHSLVKLSIDSWEPDDCPLCKQGLPIVKPGSRK